MRAILGVASLLVVLAIVGLLAARQLRATVPAGAAGAASAAAGAEAPQQLPQRVKADLTRALEQGAAATRDAADK